MFVGLHGARQSKCRPGASLHCIQVESAVSCSRPVDKVQGHIHPILYINIRDIKKLLGFQKSMYIVCSPCHVGEGIIIVTFVGP